MSLFVIPSLLHYLFIRLFIHLSAPRLIRIELCQSHCDYYTELDAVYLSGASSNDDASRQKAIDSAIDYLNFTKLSMLDKDDSDSKHPLLNGSSVEARECLGHFQVLPVSTMFISLPVNLMLEILGLVLATIH